MTLPILLIQLLAGCTSKEFECATEDGEIQTNPDSTEYEISDDYSASNFILVDDDRGFGEYRGMTKTEVWNLEPSGTEYRYNIQVVVERKNQLTLCLEDAEQDA